MIHGAIIIVCAVVAGVYLDKRYSSRITSLETAVAKLISEAKL